MYALGLLGIWVRAGAPGMFKIGAGLVAEASVPAGLLPTAGLWICTARPPTSTGEALGCIFQPLTITPAVFATIVWLPMVVVAAICAGEQV